MDLALLVYAISVLSGIKGILASLIVLAVLACIGLFIYIADQYGDAREKKAWAWKRIKVWFAVGLLSMLVLVLVPSEKTAYTMVGAYAAQKVAENEKVQQMSGKVLAIIEQKLDNYIEEGLKKPEKDKK